MTQRAYLNLYGFGHRPDCFSLPRRVFWVVACSECAASLLQPSYDYVKVWRKVTGRCQICEYLERVGSGTEAPAILAAKEEDEQQLRMF